MSLLLETATNTSFIRLTTPDAQQIADILTKGMHSSRTVKRSNILRQSDLGYLRETTVASLHVSASTVSRTRIKYRRFGLTTALHEQKRTGRPKIVDYKLQSEVRLLACSPVPAGRCRWTGQLLLEQGVKRFNWEVSRSTLFRILHSDNLKPWKKQTWCISKITEKYLESMYNVLTIYEKDYDPTQPVVCADELSIQVESNLIPPDLMVPGKPLREDYSYKKKTVINFFVAVEPKAGKRVYLWSFKKTGREFSYFCLYLVKYVYPEAQKINLVVDNFTTHNPSMFFRYLDHESAITLCFKINWIFTPAHGSWLNIAEIENNIFIKQCLKKRFDTVIQLLSQASLYLQNRNVQSIKINWTYSVSKASIKFPYLATLQSINNPTAKSDLTNNTDDKLYIQTDQPFPFININFIQENFDNLEAKKDIKLLPAPHDPSDEKKLNIFPVSSTKDFQPIKKLHKRKQSKLASLPSIVSKKSSKSLRSLEIKPKPFPGTSKQYKWKPKERLHWVDRIIFEFIKLSFLIPVVAKDIIKASNRSEFTVLNTLNHLLHKNLIIEVLYSDITSHHEYKGYISIHFLVSSDPP